MAGRKRKAGSQRGRPKRTSRAQATVEELTVPQGETQQERRTTEARRETQSSTRGRGRQRRSSNPDNYPSLEEPERGPRLRRGSEKSFGAVQAAFANDRDLEGGEEDRGPEEEGIFNEGEIRDESYDSEEYIQLNQEGIAVGTVAADSINAESLSRCVSDLAATIQTLVNKVDKLEKKQLNNQVRDNPPIINNEVLDANMLDRDRERQDDLMRDDPPRDISTQENSSETGQSVRFKNVEINNRPVLFTGGLRLGDHLPMNIKQKIWEDKFIEFANILDPDATESYSLSINNANQPTLCLTPKQKKFLSETEWTMAFDTYVAVYVQKHPEQLQDLLTYGNTIRRMMASGQSWWYYDKQFRLAREYSHCSWATVRVDLYMQNNSTNKRTFQQKFQEYPSRIPTGYCFKFHQKLKKCFNRNCSFNHKCPRCDRPHPAYQQCYTNSGPRNSRFTTNGRNQAPNTN